MALAASQPCKSWGAWLGGGQGRVCKVPWKSRWAVQVRRRDQGHSLKDLQRDELDWWLFPPTPFLWRTSVLRACSRGQSFSCHGDSLYTHPCPINFALFSASSLSSGASQIVQWFWVVYLPCVCGANSGNTISFQCLLAGRAGLVLYGMAIPLLPADSIELQQEMWCHAGGGSGTATAGCLPPRSKRREWGKREMITDWFAVMSVTLNYQVWKEWWDNVNWTWQWCLLKSKQGFFLQSFSGSFLWCYTLVLQNEVNIAAVP